jgi:hypothetical protein
MLKYIFDFAVFRPNTVGIWLLQICAKPRVVGRLQKGLVAANQMPKNTLSQALPSTSAYL